MSLFRRIPNLIRTGRWFGRAGQVSFLDNFKNLPLAPGLGHPICLGFSLASFSFSSPSALTRLNIWLG